MLDRHSELAVPDETYFVPQLADLHRGRLDPESFVSDLRRLPAIAEWALPLDDVRVRLRPGMTTGEAISAVFEAYAEREGKCRWGDKTPMYMQYLPLLERLFPDAVYVHLIRDGRDAALSFLSMPEGIVTRTWAHPRSAADFACQWRLEVLAARRLGASAGARYLEVRYEALVADPERELRSICAHAGLAFEAGMVEYSGAVDVSAKPHLQSLRRPPTPGLRDWRTSMSPEDVRAFEQIAGGLLEELGYELAGVAETALGPALRRLSYRTRAAAWRAAGHAAARSPLWRRRHPPLA